MTHSEHVRNVDRMRDETEETTQNCVEYHGRNKESVRSLDGLELFHAPVDEMEVELELLERHSKMSRLGTSRRMNEQVNEKWRRLCVLGTYYII